MYNAANERKATTWTEILGVPPLVLIRIYCLSCCDLWIKSPTSMLPHGVADPKREHGLTSFRKADLGGAMLSALFLVQGYAGIECLMRTLFIR